MKTTTITTASLKTGHVFAPSYGESECQIFSNRKINKKLSK